MSGSVHEPPPTAGSDTDVAIANPLQFQFTDTQMQIQTQIQNKLHMIFSSCYICTLSLFHIDNFIIFSGGWLWSWTSRTKRGVGDIRKCEILEKHIFSTQARGEQPLDKSPHSFCLKNLPLLAGWDTLVPKNMVSSWSRQKPGTRRDIGERWVKRAVCMLFVVGWACVRCYPLLSGSICPFLSRKLFENKPSTSDLDEFLKIDLLSLGQPLTVGVRDHSLADRVPNISERGGKQSDGKLHNHAHNSQDCMSAAGAGGALPPMSSG